jgi:hypothetical protein
VASFDSFGFVYYGWNMWQFVVASGLPSKLITCKKQTVVCQATHTHWGRSQRISDCSRHGEVKVLTRRPLALRNPPIPI